MIREIEEYINHLCMRAEKEKKEFIIWGYGKGGRFAKTLIEKSNFDVAIRYIIDEKAVNIYGSNLVLYRSSLLDYINLEEYIILSTINNFKEVEKRLFEYRAEVIDIRHIIGLSYLEYLELKNKKIDFGIVKRKECAEWLEECDEHVPFAYNCATDVFAELKNLCSDDVALFDFGCGKGGALCTAYYNGINHLGGVELIKDIYLQAITNLSELGIECDIINMDATLVNIVLDNYNCFFFYNPFHGDIFDKVIENIKESYERKPRTMWIIYANPFEHKRVVSGGFFKLFKQIEVDLYDPILNIYVKEA